MLIGRIFLSFKKVFRFYYVKISVDYQRFLKLKGHIYNSLCRYFSLYDVNDISKTDRLRDSKIQSTHTYNFVF